MAQTGPGRRVQRRRFLALFVATGLAACGGTAPPTRTPTPDGSSRRATPTPTGPVTAPTVPSRPTALPTLTAAPPPTPSPFAVVVPSPADPERRVWAVAVQDRHAYVGVGSRLVVLDFADPARPAEVARSAPFPAPVRTVVVDGRRAYVGLERRRDGVHPSGRGVRVVDIADPARPREVGSFDDLRSGMSFAVWDRHLYAADLDRGLRVIDVADPARPFEAGYYAQGHVDLVAVAGGRAYVDDTLRDLRVLEVADPTKIAQVALLRLGGVGDVALEGSTLVASGPDRDVTLFDVGGSGAPRPLGAYTSPLSFRLRPQTYRWIRPAGRYVYAKRAVGGIDIVDVTDPRNASAVGYLDAGEDLWGMVAAGHQLYLPSDSHLRIVDAADPARPTEVGRFAP